MYKVSNNDIMTTPIVFVLDSYRWLETGSYQLSRVLNPISLALLDTSEFYL